MYKISRPWCSIKIGSWGRQIDYRHYQQPEPYLFGSTDGLGTNPSKENKGWTPKQMKEELPFLEVNHFYNNTLPI